MNVLTIATEANDPAERDAFMEELQGLLEADPDVDYVLYRIDPDTAFRLGLMSLTVEELGTIRDRVHSATTLGSALSNPSSPRACSTSAPSPRSSRPAARTSRSCPNPAWPA